jgi:predicted short-subunit dehydrogenase-like oxidoreductase (DUF2520 family)
MAVPAAIVSSVSASKSGATAPLQLGFIGAGRLGTALARSMAACGYTVSAVASRSAASAEALAAGIDGTAAVSPQQVADRCDLVFVTTQDAAIAPTVAALRWRAGTAVVHCSGATEVSALASAQAQGAMIGGFHPLQTFGDPDAAIRSLPGCTITIEAGPGLDDTLVAIAQRLRCRVNRLPPGARGRYHAAAGYASRIGQSWDAHEADAVAALVPLVRGTLASIEGAGLAAGMPGPVSRGDVASVAKHVDALATLAPDVLALYRELCGRSIALGIERGGVDAAQAAQLRALLSVSAAPSAAPTRRVRGRASPPAPARRRARARAD